MTMADKGQIAIIRTERGLMIAGEQCDFVSLVQSLFYTLKLVVS